MKNTTKTIFSLSFASFMLSKIRAFGQGLIPRSKGAGFILLILLMALVGMAGVAGAAGVIPDMDLITSYSSTGGTPQFKDNDWDVAYKIQQTDVITFSITPNGAYPTLNYLWRVMKPGGSVITSSTAGTSFVWTVPSAISTWEIEIEATLKDDVGNPIGKESVSWSITTSDFKIVNPGDSIQSAIDSLSNDGGIVELTPGTYNISASITVTKKNVIFKGSGRDNTTIKINVANTQQIVINRASPPFASPPSLGLVIMNFTIKDIKLYGYSTSHGGIGQTCVGNGINGRDISDVKISNVWIENNFRAIVLLGTRDISGTDTFSTNIVIRNNKIINNGQHGMYLQVSNNGIVEENEISNIGGWGVDLNSQNAGYTLRYNLIGNVSNSGIDVYSGSENNLVQNNTIYSADREGIWVFGARGSIIEKNKIYGCLAGIRVSCLLYNNNVIIRNNLIFSNGADGGIYGQGAEEVETIRMESNIIAFNTGDGIYSPHTTVVYQTKNNIISNNGGTGLRATGNKIISNYNNVWNNTLGNYNGISAGTGDISADPLFADPAAGDFHLKSQAGRWNGTVWVNDAVTSPAIDVGDPVDDYSNEPEPNGNRINLGAYGNTAEASKSPSLATGTIAGTVKDTSNNPIQGATVSDGTRSATTDATGNYTISDVPAGTYTLTASKTGYQSASQSNVVVTEGATTTVDFVLTPIPPPNNPPVLDPIGDKEVKEGELLEFTISATDPDADTLTYAASNLPEGATFNSDTQTFSWTPDYTQAGTYENVHFEVSDGSLSDSEDISITVNDTNRAPVMLNANISPSIAYTNTDLTALAEATDADNDTITFKYQWKKNGSELAGATTQTLSSTNFVKADSITVLITPNDGKVDGTPLESAALVISNSLSTAPIVSISPVNPTDNDDLICSITTESQDLDGDTVTYSYSWYKNDVLQSGLTTNTVSSTLTSEGESWKCVVISNDGDEDGGSGKRTVEIEKTIGTIPRMGLIQSYSSAGGNPQFKDDDYDLIYKVNQGDVITFSITPTSPETMSYLWQVRQGSQILTSSTAGTTYNWTVPSEISTWEIEIEVTLKDEVGNTKGRDFLSWSITTSEIKTVSPGESIQFAIDSLPADGGIVELAPGVHNISTSISITKRNVTLKGYGWDNTTIRMTVDSTSMIMINRPIPWPVWSPSEGLTDINFTLKDLKLYGFSKVISERYAINGRDISNVTISNVWIENTYRAIILMGTRDIINYENHTFISNIVLRNNKITNLGADGIYVQYSDNGIIEGNTITGARWGIDLNSMNRGYVIRNNLISNVANSGIDIYSGSENNLIQNNTIYSAAREGIWVFGARGSIIENNTIYDCLFGIRIPPVYYNNNVIIRNNLIFSNGDGIYGEYDSREEAETIRIESNTIAFNKADGIYSPFNKLTFQTKNNIISNNGGAGLNGINIISNYNDVWNNTLGSYSGTSAGSGDISLDPLFANPAAGDFHLKSQAGRWNGTAWVSDSVTSPVIDAGDPSSDYSNEPSPNGGRINMGAYGNTAEASKSGVSTIDINQDGVIDISDLRLVALHFGETTTSPYPRYDVNTDGTIDILDLRQVAGGM